MPNRSSGAEQELEVEEEAPEPAAKAAEVPHVEVVEAPLIEPSRPHVGEVGSEEAVRREVAERRGAPQSGTVTAGKIPGGMTDVQVTGPVTVRDVLAKAGIHDLDKCRLQVNGQEARANTRVKSGDTVMAIAQIRGN